jgi:hypothetical protein
MVDRYSIAQAEANVFYPAVTQEELADDQLLLVNYRKSLGRERLLWGGIAFVAGAWVFEYLRRGRG